MGDQKQFRSEAARKNYEKQEKLRAQAAKRKELQAKKNALSGKAKAWLSANRKQVMTFSGIAVVVLVVLWLACKWFIGPKGSIPNFFGHLVGVQDNWVIIDTSEDSKNPLYHHLADFDYPEGFQPDDFTVFSDGVQQDFYGTAVEDSGVVCDFYVAATKNLSADEYIDTLLDFESHQTASEPKQAVIAGKDAKYVYLTFDESDTDGEGMAFSCLCIYFDTPQGSAVSAMINSYTLPAAEVPDEAALLAEAEHILAGLTLVK